MVLVFYLVAGEEIPPTWDWASSSCKKGKELKGN